MKKRGIIKKILKDHFAGYWYMHAEKYPASFRDDIKKLCTAVQVT